MEAGREARYGVFDPTSPIAIRLFGPERITEQRIQALVQRALARREQLDRAGTDSYRLIHGESDFLPAIVADKYGRYAVLKAYSPAVRQFLPTVARVIGRSLKLRGVVEREDQPGGARLTALFGELPPEELTITEHGVKLLVNTVHGQKTGLFLDQRENRAFVKSIAANTRVLNLFAYTGAFSILALAGGATHVTSVDIAAGALEIARRQVAMNGFAERSHDTLELDIFADLHTVTGAYDVVIVDPPSLANNRKQLSRALSAYRAVNTAAVRLVAPGGWFITASCTAQVTPEAFREVVQHALTSAGVHAELMREAGHAPDHPARRHFPEGQYLTCLAFRVRRL